MERSRILDARYAVTLLAATTLGALDAIGCNSSQRNPTPLDTVTVPASASVAPPTETGVTSAVATAAIPTMSTADGAATLLALRALSHEQLVHDADELLKHWLDAQNKRDFGAYIALYEPSEFTGLKRVGDEVKRYDFAGWKHDREGMFTSNMQLAAEDVQIRTWRDVSRLQEGLLEVEFVQRFRSAHYADHGPKKLLLWRSSPTADWHIVFEEMLVSRVGWSDAAARADALKRAEAELAAQDDPQRRDSATAALKRLGVTMQTAEQVGRRLAESPHRDRFARALSELGGFECLQQLEFERCGAIEHDWGKVETATLEHACVRRALLLPSLASGQLEGATLGWLTPRLTAAIGSGASDAELTTAIVSTLDRQPPESAVPFAVALLQAPIGNPAASKVYAKLDSSSALTLARRFRRAEPVAHLNPSVHFEALYAIDSSGLGLGSELMLPVIEKLREMRRVAELTTLASDPRCDVAMAAAHALNSLGQSQYLPRWRDASNVELALQTVCRLRHDPDIRRRNTELTQFIDPKRGVRLLTVTETEPSSPEEAQASFKLAETQMTPGERELLRRLPELRGMNGRGLRRATEEVLRNVGPEVFTTCDAFDEDGTQTLGFTVDSEGHAVLDFVGSYQFSDHSCPC